MTRFSCWRSASPRLVASSRRNPEGTLNEVRDRGTMKVGVTHADPFVNLAASEPAGVEVELMKAFARHLGVEIEWVEASESQLVELLKGTEIDVMLAGPERQSPLQEEVACTRPYANVEIVLAVPPDADTRDIEGLDVLVEENTRRPRSSRRRPTPIQSGSPASPRPRVGRL